MKFDVGQIWSANHWRIEVTKVSAKMAEFVFTDEILNKMDLHKVPLTYLQQLVWDLGLSLKNPD